MAAVNQQAGGPVGGEPPNNQIQPARSNEGCPGGALTCAHGPARHELKVIGKTYGVDQGVAVWCKVCKTACYFKLFPGPDAVPKPKFTAGDDRVVDEGDEIIEPPLEVLFLSESRRASDLNVHNSQA